MDDLSLVEVLKRETELIDHFGRLRLREPPAAEGHHFAVHLPPAGILDHEVAVFVVLKVVVDAHDVVVAKRVHNF